jgi:hypothetical protein
MEQPPRTPGRINMKRITGHYSRLQIGDESCWSLAKRRFEYKRSTKKFDIAAMLIKPKRLNHGDTIAAISLSNGLAPLAETDPDPTHRKEQTIKVFSSGRRTETQST